MSSAAHGPSSEHARNILVATLANLEIGFVVLNPGLTDVNSRTVETAVSMGPHGGPQTSRER